MQTRALFYDEESRATLMLATKRVPWPIQLCWIKFCVHVSTSIAA